MNDLDTIAYFSAAAQRPESWQRGDWGCARSQRARFDVLVEELGHRSKRGESVLDVGCGDGALGQTLRTLDVRYTGWDLIRPQGPDCEQRNLMAETRDRFDWVVASGLWTYRPRQWAYAALDRMWALCRRGVIVNSLSSVGHARPAGELAMAPEEFLLCGLVLSPTVSLRHDYLPGDMTLVVSR